MSLKNERDSTIKSLFQKHNLGSLPSGPFSDEVALDLTDQIQSKLKDINKDLQEKKVLFSPCSFELCILNNCFLLPIHDSLYSTSHIAC